MLPDDAPAIIQIDRRLLNALERLASERGASPEKLLEEIVSDALLDQYPDIISSENRLHFERVRRRPDESQHEDWWVRLAGLTGKPLRTEDGQEFSVDSLTDKSIMIHRLDGAFASRISKSSLQKILQLNQPLDQMSTTFLANKGHSLVTYKLALLRAVGYGCATDAAANPYSS